MPTFIQKTHTGVVSHSSPDSPEVKPRRPLRNEMLAKVTLCTKCNRPNKSENPEKYPECWNCTHSECEICGKNVVQINKWKNTTCFNCTKFKNCTKCSKKMKTDNKYDICFDCNLPKPSHP